MDNNYHQLDQLRTRRCLLRPVMLVDAPAILRLYSNPDVIRFTEYHVPMQSLDEAIYSIHFYRRGYTEGWMYRWGIVLWDTKELIGTAGLHRLDRDNQFSSIGYEIDSPYWNRGLSTEIVKCLTHHGFIHFKLHRIEAELIPQNIASARVVQKNGYRYEATRRQHLFKRGDYYDIDVYSLLYDEWLEQQDN